MSIFLLSLLIAAIVCGGVLWRRPDARAAASGAWEAGKSQAVREFRDGYTFAQQKLRAGNPRAINPRRWASWGLAATYGACKTIAAANRIRRSAWDGGRDRYRQWKDSQPVDGEVIEAVVVKRDDQPAPPPATDQPAPEAQKPTSQPEPADDSKPQPEPAPSPEAEPVQEGTEMQTEATGLTSYATAHQEFAQELRNQMSGSENLAASMAEILNENSDLLGETAQLQDLLNQAAGVAERIANRALEVANN
ncbi:hypothetical protein E1286_05345 [Nonomuraea terrae]|uniref:Uncharacterized protein n=1 Tax=Nonomuraea terrae TaxID=2530383 RepID=A0A4R4Z8V1_9ACTN|nr:hypothetical protein [Nonomuraea terrae]TDD54615.1 hypothetical protein E1286_05345 [Nonomuraea terrae]